MEPWAEKYRPRKLSEILGQPAAIRELVSWANSWKERKPVKKAALLYGPPGTGKSAAARALASDFGWDYLEMNASDQRTMSQVKTIAGTAATTGTLFGARGALRLVVIDEADRIHGTVDRGGYQALMDLVKNAGNPVILIANDPYEIPWELRASCLQINFRRLSAESIAAGLQRICRSEGISAEQGALMAIAEASRGDMRAAINDLQAIACGRKTLKPDELPIHRRDAERNVFDFLKALLSAKTAAEARELLWSLDMQPDEALGWISENVPKIVADPKNRAMVYDALSRADVFLGMAKRGYGYGFWGYASDLMSSGVSVLKGDELKWSKFEPPAHVRRLARSRGERAVLESLAKKIGERCHASSRIARRDIIPYIRIVAKRDRAAQRSIAEELDLTEAELKFLTT
jgi:replication factor C large subunit